MPTCECESMFCGHAGPCPKSGRWAKDGMRLCPACRRDLREAHADLTAANRKAGR